MLRFLLVLFLFISCYSKKFKYVDDVSQLNRTRVKSVEYPKSILEVKKILKSSKDKVSIGGGKFSQGGQTIIKDGIQINLGELDKVISLDIPKKEIRVQAGTTWRDIQKAIDPYNLSIKIMQTYSNFTVGGSLSVNAHGRYIGEGAIIKSVLSLKLILANGDELECNRDKNSKLFFGVIGGYGGLGIISEVTLKLEENSKIERIVEFMNLEDYRKYFFKNIRNKKKYIFHNADLYPPDFKKLAAISWKISDKELTIQDRLPDFKEKRILEPLVVGSVANISGLKKLRAKYLDPLIYSKPEVVFRNFEASYDVLTLEPLNRKFSTYVLQEYFIPIQQLEVVLKEIKKIFKKYDVNVINLSIRHSKADTESILSWAREEVFSLVVYTRQGVKESDQKLSEKWTREVLERILISGGTYYLPYQLHASKKQFLRAYPRIKEFLILKKKYDPDNRFSNKLWEKYL